MSRTPGHLPDALAAAVALFAAAVWIFAYCLACPAAHAAALAAGAPISDPEPARGALVEILVAACAALFTLAIIGIWTIWAQLPPSCQRDDLSFGAFERAPDFGRAEFESAERDHPDVAAAIRASAARRERRDWRRDGALAFFPVATLSLSAANLIWLWLA
jgi:hypothetical protein